MVSALRGGWVQIRLFRLDPDPNLDPDQSLFKKGVRIKNSEYVKKNHFFIFLLERREPTA